MTVRAMATPAAIPDRLTLIVFGALVLLGGANYVAARISNLELAPFWGAGLRLLGAALVLGTVAIVRRLGLPSRRALRDIAAYAVLAFFLPYAFIYYALTTISAGLAAFIMAVVPLLTFFLAWLQGLESFRASGVAGGMLSVAGIGLMVSGSLGSTLTVGALLAVALSALTAAQASVFSKRISVDCHPITANGLAMVGGAALLLALSVLTGESWLVPERPRTWLALAYLIVLGTSLVFVLFLWVMRRWTASATSYAFVLYPIVAAVLSAALTGEALSPMMFLSGVVVLGGVYLGAVARPDARRPHPQVCPEPCVGT